MGHIEFGNTIWFPYFLKIAFHLALWISFEGLRDCFTSPKLEKVQLSEYFLKPKLTSYDVDENLRSQMRASEQRHFSSSGPLPCKHLSCSVDPRPVRGRLRNSSLQPTALPWDCLQAARSIGYRGGPPAKVVPTYAQTCAAYLPHSWFKICFWAQDIVCWKVVSWVVCLCLRSWSLRFTLLRKITKHFMLGVVRKLTL